MSEGGRECVDGFYAITVFVLTRFHCIHIYVALLEMHFLPYIIS